MNAEAPQPRLLIVDDDPDFCWALRRAMTRRGYEVETASTADAALEAVGWFRPAYAVVDLKLGHSSGLAVLASIKAVAPDLNVVVLTGYASIATTVEAIKLGATNYLIKPVDADALERAFRRTEADATVAPPERPLSLDRVEWEHIQSVLVEWRGNITQAAQALGLHRRTLQRKLMKRPAGM